MDIPTNPKCIPANHRGHPVDIKVQGVQVFHPLHTGSAICRYMGCPFIKSHYFIKAICNQACGTQALQSPHNIICSMASGIRVNLSHSRGICSRASGTQALQSPKALGFPHKALHGRAIARRHVCLQTCPRR